jgi:endonuclease/exonuclease/phosphatase family metal-dependent hydrolase
VRLPNSVTSLSPSAAPATTLRTDPPVARILTYNVHRWVGTDRQIAPARIAEVIASCAPDIVALQEVRVGSPKSRVDQAAAVAAALGMDMHFQPTIRMFGEQFGIAILTKHPSRLVQAGRLPSLSSGAALEKRCALWARVSIGGREVQVINAHLSLRARERYAQAQALLGPGWLGHPGCGDPAILLGDFNAPPHSRSYRLFATHLSDAQSANPTGQPQPTFHTRAPVLRLDHVFTTPSLQVMEAGPVRTRLTRIASDHYPLLARIRMRSPGEDVVGLGAMI